MRGYVATDVAARCASDCGALPLALNTPWRRARTRRTPPKFEAATRHSTVSQRAQRRLLARHRGRSSSGLAVSGGAIRRAKCRVPKISLGATHRAPIPSCVRDVRAERTSVNRRCQGRKLTSCGEQVAWAKPSALVLRHSSRECGCDEITRASSGRAGQRSVRVAAMRAATCRAPKSCSARNRLCAAQNKCKVWGVSAPPRAQAGS